MHASSGGPFGALLMIAPLAAIPVFAIIGVPHFTPVAASPADEEEFVDLGAAVSRVSSSFESSSRVSRPAARRSADDLFAPYQEAQPPRTEARPPAGTERDPSGDFGPRETPDRTRIAQPAPKKTALREERAEPASRPTSIRPAARQETDDPWEVVSDLPGRFDEPYAARAARSRAPDVPAPRHPDADHIDEGRIDRLRAELLAESRQAEPRRKADRARPAEPAATTEERETVRGSFDAGLLEGDSGARPQESTGSRRGSRTSSGPTPQREPAEPRDGIADPGDLPHERGEQAGWQAAARRLKELGIRRYRLVSQIEEQQFLFRCELPTPSSPNVTELFEAVAETPLEAVRQTLEQIEAWLRPPTGRRFVPLE